MEDWSGRLLDSLGVVWCGWKLGKGVDERNLGWMTRFSTWIPNRTPDFVTLETMLFASIFVSSTNLGSEFGCS